MLEDRIGINLIHGAKKMKFDRKKLNVSFI